MSDFDVPDPERPFDAAVDLHSVGPCKKCFHGVRSHSPRSGLCGVAGCTCEVFDGPGIQPWEVEDPIDYEHGVRALKNAETIEEAHEPYAHPVLGGWGGYQAACHTCSWRGRVRHTKAEAWDDALPHGPEMKFQMEAHESISEYAARVADERDRLRAALEAVHPWPCPTFMGRDECPGCEALGRGKPS